MEGGVFTSSMSVLINGSPLKDFEVTRELRQGDPLSTFLFTLVAEGLACLFKKVEENGVLRGFRLNSQVTYNLLQFADDTIVIGEDGWNNLWAIKSIMRGFEMVSSLRINMVKSKM